MREQAGARAFANIALIKYWGKKPGQGNLPATPSISLTLAGLMTETTVRRIEGRKDVIFLNGTEADSADRRRLVQYLGIWRSDKLLSGSFEIHSQNSFPTASGLASSASGFAALATALAALSDAKLSAKDISALARRGSGSAARSIPGGMVALPAGSDATAKQLAEAKDVPWGMVVVVVGGGKKIMPSTEGMEHTAAPSPFYGAWVKQAKDDFRDMAVALKHWDLAAAGRLMEENTLAMHSAMIASRPPLVYWHSTTLAVIEQVQLWRSEGLKCWYTIDAGAHLALLAKREDLKEVAKPAGKIKGVARAFACEPGGPAELIS